MCHVPVKPFHVIKTYNDIYQSDLLERWTMERICVIDKLGKYLTQIMTVFLANITCEICSSEGDLLGEHI
jgi:hypothetical protein